jgi:hypothetical protein
VQSCSAYVPKNSSKYLNFGRSLFLTLSALSFSSCEYKEVSDKDIRAVYIGKNADIEKIKSVLKTYGANAVIIDVKNDTGEITGDLQLDGASLVKDHMEDLHGFIQKLKESGIYTIARIVAFKDFKRDDLCFKTKDGNVWIDKEKNKWIDPRNKIAWEYILTISKKAVEIGFDEIQFDYVRFSSYFDKDGMNTDNISKPEVICEFLEYATKEIHKIGGLVSADVFGCIVDGATDPIAEKNAKIIGQDYVKVAQIVDYLCPMIYPSHFTKQSMGIELPDLEPYEVIHKFLALSKKMLSSIPKNYKVAIVRPYLQAFTAKWLTPHQVYGKKQIMKQIQAVYDSNIQQWSLFNFSIQYPVE